MWRESNHPGVGQRQHRTLITTNNNCNNNNCNTSSSTHTMLGVVSLLRGTTLRPHARGAGTTTHVIGEGFRKVFVVQVTRQLSLSCVCLCVQHVVQCRPPPPQVHSRSLVEWEVMRSPGWEILDFALLLSSSLCYLSAPVRSFSRRCVKQHGPPPTQHRTVWRCELCSTQRRCSVFVQCVMGNSEGTIHSNRPSHIVSSRVLGALSLL